MVKLLFALIATLALCSSVKMEQSAVSVVSEIYSNCLQHYSTSCVKPKALAWLSRVINDDTIKITNDLTIERTGFAEKPRTSDTKIALFETIDNFLTTHTMRIRVPEELKTLGTFVPRSLLENIPEDVNVPLSDANNLGEGRSSFVKKVMIPFVLGLKFKAAVLIPLALSLIALKTWKALTLGLLSMVLSGALVIFKLTKPKVVSYEVVHYPQHVEHQHHVEHPTGWEHNPHAHHGYGRGLDAQQMAYKAYQ